LTFQRRGRRSNLDGAMCCTSLVDNRCNCTCTMSAMVQQNHPKSFSVAIIQGFASVSLRFSAVSLTLSKFSIAQRRRTSLGHQLRTNSGLKVYFKLIFISQSQPSQDLVRSHHTRACRMSYSSTFSSTRHTTAACKPLPRVLSLFSCEIPLWICTLLRVNETDAD
jgi:hypothetical protein